MSFAPLPQPCKADGAPRRVGVEVEMGGLPEGEVARICADALGGRAVQVDSHIWAVEESAVGRVDVYLDIFLRKAEQSRLRDLALDLGREVVPVEIVTGPLDMDGLARGSTPCATPSARRARWAAGRGSCSASACISMSRSRARRTPTRCARCWPMR